MPVRALSARSESARSQRHVSHAAGPGRIATIRRPQAEAPALTVTLAIPLTNDTLTPQAHRLIDAVRELVELSHGSVALTPSVSVLSIDGDDEPGEDLSIDEDDSGPELRLLISSRQVLLDGAPLPLTRLEFDLLLYLAEHPRRVFTRTQLLTGVWGYEHTGERTVDVHVRRLRVKLGGSLPLITTVYGVGYRLSDDARIVILPHD